MLYVSLHFGRLGGENVPIAKAAADDVYHDVYPHRKYGRPPMVIDDSRGRFFASMVLLGALYIVFVLRM